VLVGQGVSIETEAAEVIQRSRVKVDVVERIEVKVIVRERYSISETVQHARVQDVDVIHWERLKVLRRVTVLRGRFLGEASLLDGR
jgi:hypothetical protein